MSESYIDNLLENKDKYDINTRVGLLNRLALLDEKQSLSDKYNFDEQSDPVGYKYYELQDKQFWTNTEMNFSLDIRDYKRADIKIKNALDLILAFFASGDGLITKNLAFRFIPEARSVIEISALMVQVHQEIVHAENYTTTIKSMIPSEKKRNKLLTAVDNLPCVNNKALIIEKYMMADLPMSYRLIAFAATEGIFFWSSFAVLFWFRTKRNKEGTIIFENIVTSNTQISKDESMHRDYGVARYNALPNNERLNTDIVHKIVDEFVKIEKEFADSVLPEEYEDLNAKDIKDFVEYMANNLLIGLGYDRLYKVVKVPESMYWMEIGSMSQKSNFYEVDVVSYKREPINSNKHKTDHDEDYSSEDIDDVHF